MALQVPPLIALRNLAYLLLICLLRALEAPCGTNLRALNETVNMARVYASCGPVRGYSVVLRMGIDLLISDR